MVPVAQRTARARFAGARTGAILAVDEVDVLAELHLELLVAHKILTVDLVNDARFRRFAC